MPGHAAPICFAHAQGAHLTDVDGNDYVDYALGMGPAILGHSPKVVTDAVAQSLQLGQLYAGQSRLELELARRIQQHVPAAELVRIGMTGSEMVQAALRVARAATQRSKFVKFAGHYHGWFDNVLTNDVSLSTESPMRTTRAKPQTGGQAQTALADTVVLPWNDLSTLQAYLALNAADTAAIIMEPVMCNTGVIPPAPEYLEGVRRLCDENGIILIIDEVITGFRLGLSGAQGLFGVVGDLSIFAKALGGGVPIAALTGRRALMSLIGSGAVNHSGTYNSNIIAVTAAIATLDALAAGGGALYSSIGSIGQTLIDGMRAIAKQTGDNLVVQGFPSVFNTSFCDVPSVRTVEDYQGRDEMRHRRFLAVLLERGVRPTARGTWFVSSAHTETEVEATLSAVRDALDATR
jgi:glutamate-1-semialdehyde 2,1-aminomutase